MVYYMTDSPFNGADVTVTIKRGADYGASWNVFRGTPQGVKEQMVEYYGLDADALADADPGTVEMEAMQAARAGYLVADQLGGKVQSINKTKPASKAKKAPSKPKPEPEVNEGQAQDNDAAEEDALAGIRAEIARITNPDDLNKLWAKNQQAFVNGDLLDEWKARGRELVAGGN